MFHIGERFEDCTVRSLLSNYYLLRMIPVEIEEIRRMSNRNNLNGRTTFAVVVWICQPVHRILYLAEQTRVNAMLRLLKAYYRWGLRQVCYGEKSEGDKRSLRKVSCANRMFANTR